MILITILILSFILILIVCLRSQPMWPVWNDEETTVTTTTVEEPKMNVVGGLKRELDGQQFYVIDPADKTKTWINSNDDMYEDADGKIWRLM